MPERLTSGTGSGSEQNFATPTATANQLAPSMMKHPSCAAMWRTPAAQEPGISIDRLETRTGEPVGSMCRHYDKETGRMAQIGLSQQVAARMWPTPFATDHKGAGTNGELRDRLDYAAERGGTKSNEYPAPPKTGGQLNPTWVEWLMGWPIGWTDLKPLETGKFQAWRRSHGEF